MVLFLLGLCPRENCGVTQSHFPSLGAALSSSQWGFQFSKSSWLLVLSSTDVLNDIALRCWLDFSDGLIPASIFCVICRLNILFGEMCTIQTILPFFSWAGFFPLILSCMFSSSYQVCDLSILSPPPLLAENWARVLCTPGKLFTVSCSPGLGGPNFPEAVLQNKFSILTSSVYQFSFFWLFSF